MQLPMRFEVAAGYATGLIMALLLACSVREGGAKCGRRFDTYNGVRHDCDTLNYGQCELQGAPFISEPWPTVKYAYNEKHFWSARLLNVYVLLTSPAHARGEVLVRIVCVCVCVSVCYACHRSSRRYGYSTSGSKVPTESA